MHPRQPRPKRAQKRLPKQPGARSTVDSHHALGRFMVVIRDSGLVFDDLAIEFVHQQIDRGIKVGVSRFDMDFAPTNMQRDLCFLL